MDGNGQTVKIHDGHLPAQKHKTTPPNHAKATILDRSQDTKSEHPAHLQLLLESADDEVGFIAEKLDQLSDEARRVFVLAQLLQLLEQLFVQQTLYPSPTHQKPVQPQKLLRTEIRASRSRSNGLPWRPCLRRGL
jgi:hypothetical protein